MTAGACSGPFGLMTIAPVVEAEAVQSVGSALRFGSGLSPRIREIAILVIAARFRSEFEWFAHEPAASASGIAEHQLDQLKAGSIPEDLSSEEALAASLIESMLAHHPSPIPPIQRRTAVPWGTDAGRTGLALRLLLHACTIPECVCTRESVGRRPQHLLNLGC